MISKAELSKAWAGIIPQAGDNVGRRADVNHPLDFFITYDETPNMQLMLITDFMYTLPHSSSQILVRGNQRNDGKYAVCFSLVDNQLRDQYVSLCWDIMDCTNDVQDKKKGTLVAIERFTMWQKLLAEFKTKQMTETGIKGLIGELTVLKDICIPKYGVSSAIAGWIGPLGADRDFEYSDYWYESKYVSLSMDNVRISSLDQLDIDNEGFIILVRAEKTSHEVDGSITLYSLVNKIQEFAFSDEKATHMFKDRLNLLCYDALDERVNVPYIVHRLENYHVFSDEFPRIRRYQIHSAVSNGEYTLSIPAIQQWRLNIIY